MVSTVHVYGQDTVDRSGFDEVFTPYKRVFHFDSPKDSVTTEDALGGTPMREAQATELIGEFVGSGIFGRSYSTGEREMEGSGIIGFLDFTVDTKLSLEWWVIQPQPDQPSTTLLHLGDCQNAQGFRLWQANRSKLQVESFQSDGICSVDVFNEDLLAPDVPHYVVVQIDYLTGDVSREADYATFIDGELVASAASIAAGKVTASDTSFGLGSNISGRTSRRNDVIDELRLSTTFASPEHVLATWELSQPGAIDVGASETAP